MGDLNTQMLDRYRSDFLAEVEANVEEGEWVKMCMQCGVCSGSCPFGPHWEHPPQELFMMIRAGQREAVLSSNSMWLCTSCYNCIVRCPRGLPITHLMHGLAHYSARLGLAPKQQPTRKFGLLFWNNIAKNGRVNEPILGIRIYFMNGFKEGVKMVLKMAPVGWGMLRTKRFNVLSLVPGLHRGCKKKRDIFRILEKARATEIQKTRFGG